MKDWFKNSEDDYQVFYWGEVIAFAFCGLLMSGFFGVVLSLPHWIAFSIGYPITFVIAMKLKHKEVNEDVKGYLEFKNKNR